MTFPELIRNQEEVLQRLLLFSQRQREIVDKDNPTLLLEHLGQRERLWHEFEQLDQQLSPHKGIPPERRVWRSDAERQLTEASQNRCLSLLEEIMANDEISLAKAAELKDEKEKDLRRIQRAKTAASGYARMG